MRTSFVVRLLDAEAHLLAWARVEAVPRREEGARASCPFRVLGPTRFVVERAGTATQLAIHWPDLDVARLGNVTAPIAVDVGQVFAFDWIEPIWIVSGQRDVPLPEVTERAPVTLAPPVAQMGARP